MNDVETIYTQYEDIVSEFTEQVIKNQYASLYRECTAFLESLGVSDHTRIDKAILTHTVMDYFTDISRMKEFHHVKHISERKALAYETYWILRRKPIQVMINNGNEEFWAFLNEKFSFTRIASFLTREQKSVILDEASKKTFLSFLDTLYYFLKYRTLDPKTLELVIMGFQQAVGHLLLWGDTWNGQLFCGLQYALAETFFCPAGVKERQEMVSCRFYGRGSAQRDGRIG